jgi:hypothetical protein
MAVMLKAVEELQE